VTFHTFYPKTFKGQYYLDYDSEATWEDIVDSVLHDEVKPKMECPAIVLNRFKTLQTEHGPTVKNRYENLEHTTGWFGLDVDGTGKLTALTKRVIFEKLPEVKLVWVSSSGDGVKAIGYNPQLKNLSPKEFRMQSLIMSLMFRTRCSMKINFDSAMHRCHQPIFINSDPTAFYR
jgi:hypothetical protein